MARIGLRNIEVFLQQELYKFFLNPIHLDKDHRISGIFAWVSIFLFVLAYDIYAIKTRKAETLTRFFWRSTENKSTSTLTHGVWILLSFHLLIEKPLRRFFQKRNIYEKSI